MMAKKLLPYIGIPLILAAYLSRKCMTYDVMACMYSAALIIFGYVAAYSDLTTRKVPNRLVLSMLATWSILMAVHIIFDIETAILLFIQSLIGGAAAGGFFLFLYILSRKGVGGGDVKLVAVMGLFLTIAKLMPMLFLSSLLAALASAVLLLIKRVTIKTAIPLVPFLYIGTLIVILEIV